jgi:hypothetical protein
LLRSAPALVHRVCMAANFRSSGFVSPKGFVLRLRAYCCSLTGQLIADVASSDCPPRVTLTAEPVLAAPIALFIS